MRNAMARGKSAVLINVHGCRAASADGLAVRNISRDV